MHKREFLGETPTIATFARKIAEVAVKDVVFVSPVLEIAGEGGFFQRLAFLDVRGKGLALATVGVGDDARIEIEEALIANALRQHFGSVRVCASYREFAEAAAAAWPGAAADELLADANDIDAISRPTGA